VISRGKSCSFVFVVGIGVRDAGIGVLLAGIGVRDAGVGVTTILGAAARLRDDALAPLSRVPAATVSACAIGPVDALSGELAAGIRSALIDAHACFNAAPNAPSVG
jgi:hypothetical protein